jgi:hypothetical protein
MTGATEPPSVFQSTIFALEASRRWYRDQSAAMLIHPRPNPVMTMVSAPMTAPTSPFGMPATTDQLMWPIVSAM